LDQDFDTDSPEFKKIKLTSLVNDYTFH